MVFFQSMVPPSVTSGKQVAVVLAVVVVHVRRADAVLHQVECRLDALVHVGVAGVEDVIQTEVRQLLELQQSLGAGKLVGNILQQDLDAALAGEDAAAPPARRRPRRTCACRTPRRRRPCAGSGTGTESPRRSRGALDLVHHVQTLRFHRLGDGDHGMRSGAAPDLVVVHRRVQRVQLQLGIAEPVAQFG